MSRVAKRYAKALFASADELNILDKIEQDFIQFIDLAEQSEDFNALISNPLINDKDTLAAIQEIFKSNLQDLTNNFLGLLAEKKRIDFLPQIAEEFRLMLLIHANKVEGELTSAAKLGADQVVRIKENVEHMTGKEVLLTEKVDKTVLGGFVVNIEGWVLDNSIRYQLSKLRERLIAR